MALSTGSGAARSVVYRIQADVAGVLAPMRQASASVKKFGDDVTAVSKEGDKLRRGFDTMGRNAGRVGLIAAAGLGAMVLKAANFEQAMSNVAAATHETETNMGLLRDAALEFGAETQFSATEAAGAIENLAKAGVSTADILGGGLKGALDLAAAGQIPVAEAAEFTATALTQFQLAGTEAAHVADLLAAGAGKAQGEVGDMALALSYAGVPAANLGVSIEETSGAIALFASNGIIGERAGTSLRGMLSSLTSPSKVAQKEMERLGISMFDAQGEFIGLGGVAEQLQSRLSGLTEQERANALGRIFGNEQLQAANVLYREGARGVQDWTRNVNDAGFAAETARIKTDNLRGDLERLGGALDTALISGGSGSQGALRNLVQSLTAVVDAYNKLPASAQGAATGLLATGAIVGGSLWAGSKLINTINDTRQALDDMGPAGAKASKALKGIALAGAGLGVLLVAAEGIKAIQRATQETLPGLETLNSRLIDLQAGRVANLGSEFDSLAESIGKIDANTFKGIRGFGNLDVSEILTKPFGIFGIEDSGLIEAKAEVEALDQSLASLVTQGSPELAANALIAVGEAAGLSEEQMAQLRELLPAYEDALSGTANAATLNAEAQADLAKETQNVASTMGFTEEQIKKAKDAYIEAKDAARGIAEEFFGVGEKVDKAKVSLGEWLTDLEKSARALEQFTANAEKAAKRGLDKGLIKSLEEAGPAGARRMEQLANATDSEIDRANRAWKRGQDAIDRYVKATTKIPNPLRVKADTSSANTALDALIRKIGQLRSAQIDVRLGGTPTFATGGRVVGPGTGTSDSIPAYLSNGEYVIKAAAVARYGVAMFDRLNAMHFAQGGFVGGGAPASIDLSSLAALVAQQRPLVNHMDVQVKNYDDLKRIEQRVRVAASSDGLPPR